MKLKEKFKGVRLTKKRVIIFCALIVAIGVVSVFAMRAFARTSLQTALPKSIARTVILEKTTLSESVTVTGTLESSSLTNVASTLNYPVSEILVKEGENVKEGQMLAKLDPTELNKQIARQQETYAENITRAQASYDDAVLNRDTAYNKAIAAEATLATALNTKNSAESAMAKAKSSVSAFQKAYTSAAAAEKTAGTALNKANTALLKDSANADLAAQAQTAQAAYDAAVQNAQAAKSALDGAKIACNYDAASKAYDAAVQAHEGQRNALDNLQFTYTNTLNNFENAEYSLKSAKEDEQLSDLLEKLDECTILATATGTVTNVNATLGSAPLANGALFVIQDTDNLKVAVSIDEYDIKSITTGMKAKIKSDATGDAEILGTVTQVSQTAQASMGSSSSTSFGAQVTIDGKSELLIGMNAKVEIIISEKANVLTVPYDAVGENENGESIVYKQIGNEFEPVVITKGMETDYYVEISGDNIAQGDVIRASAVQTIEQSSTTINGSAMPGGMAFDITAGGGRPQGGTYRSEINMAQGGN